MGLSDIKTPTDYPWEWMVAHHRGSSKTLLDAQDAIEFFFKNPDADAAFIRNRLTDQTWEGFRCGNGWDWISCEPDRCPPAPTLEEIAAEFYRKVM